MLGLILSPSGFCGRYWEQKLKATAMLSLLMIPQATGTYTRPRFLPFVNKWNHETGRLQSQLCVLMFSKLFARKLLLQLRYVVNVM